MLLSTACIIAEEKDQGKVQAKEEGGDPLLSPDEFSKAFSKPVYRDKTRPSDTTDDPEDTDLPYKKDYLGKHPFNNESYKDSEVPADSLAASIVRRHDYFWLPRWHFHAKGEVYIPDAALSQDSSMLAILETVPGNSGSQGSMVIFINTYNWTISRIHYFRGRLFTRIMFTPLSPSVLVWEETQKDVHNRRLHRIGISSGEIEDSSGEIPDPFSGIAISPSGEQIFLKTQNNETELYVFITDKLSKRPLKRECGADSAFLLPSGRTLLVIGEKKILEFNISHMQKTGETENPSGSIPDTAICADGGKIAMASYMGPAYLVHRGQGKLLDRSAGKALHYKADTGVLAFEVFRNREVKLLRLSDFSEIPGIVPPRVKPHTAGAAVLLSYLEHHDRYMILDSSGNLGIYNKPGKRWHKKMIFSAQKTVE